MEQCLVCNGKTSACKNYIKDVFSDLNILPSSRKLLATLREILDKPLDEQSCHSRILCRKCYKSCADYDGLKSKMLALKTIISQDYTDTINNRNVVPINREEKPANTIVVPASKLVPVPADFQLNFSSLAGFGQLGIPNDQIANASQMNIANVYNTTKATPLINLKVTIGSSVFTQSLTTSTVKIGKSQETIDNINTVMTTKEDGWNTNLVPNEIFSNNDETSQNDDENISENSNDGDRDDDTAMKIVEDSSHLAVEPDSEQNVEIEFDLGSIKTENALGDETQYINVSMQDDGSMVSADGNFVLGKLTILNEGEDGEQHTLIVDGDKSSILEMMSGQRLVYDNGQLQLVMNDDAADGDEQQDGDEGDAQESNDENQIELQVSGDEETANAIIAAAQERGGAFIKVESGEMYRVQSVVSAEGPEPDVTSLAAKVGDSFRCKLCLKTDERLNVLMDGETMMHHMKSQHGVRLYLCQLCGDGMKKRTDYTKHLATHVKSEKSIITRHRIHECEICQKGFSSRTLLAEHMNIHTGTRPYVCSVCKKAFASKYTHQAHVKTHQSRPRPFKCKECNKSFLSQQNLTQHEKTHLGLRPFKCNICGKSFGTQRNLEVHGVVHSGERPHVCSVCDKAFARRAELSDHTRIHTGERPFACETCGARFAQRSNLHSHRRATHLHDKRHHCQHCNKRFKRRRLLDYHIKSSHTGERPLKCEVCNATFVYPEHYKKHARIHSGERPYYCEICGKSFNSRDNRNTHRFTHSDKKPYECLACGRSYMRKRQLIAHMNLSGHLGESIVVNQPRVTRVHNTENGVTTIVQLNEGEIQKSEQNETEAIFHTSSKLELLEESTASLIKLPKDSSKLFMNLVENETEESVLIEAVNSTQLDTDTAQLTTSESGAMLRLIQVQLPDGNDGWVALND